MKKLSQILLLALIAVTLVSALVFSASAATYTIRDAADFKTYLYDSQYWSGGHTFNITADIDLSSVASQTPIGTNGTPFNGTVNGNSKTISGINISSSSQFVGLFGATNDATIKSLTIEGTVKSTFTDASTNISAYVGGLIGRSRGDLTLTSVISKIAVTASGSDVGGLVGQIAFTDSAGNTVKIAGCYNRGVIKGYKYVGGLVGRVAGSENISNVSTLTITNSDNNAAVTAEGNCAAGIVAYYDYRNTTDVGALSITECANTANISAYGYASGILGGYLYKSDVIASTLTMSNLLNRGTINSTNAAQAGAIAGIVRIPLNCTSASLTISDGLHTGPDSGEAMVGILDTGTATLTFSRLYNRVGTKIFRETSAVSGKTTLRSNTVTLDGCCNSKATEAELSTLVASNDLWTTGVDDLVFLSSWKRNEHAFSNGSCVHCGMTVNDGLIGTYSELYALMSDSSLWDGSYKLTADIDLTDLAQSPIGNGTTPFSGSFNGDGYTIRGLKLSGTSHLGLFGVIKDATIKNLTVEGTVTGTSHYVGGFVGVVRANGNVTIENCVSNVTVTSTGSYVGGIVGLVRYYADNASVTIKNCVNNKAVKGATAIGGIVGRVDSTSDSAFAGCGMSISGCYNYATITATTNSPAGILGVYEYYCPADGEGRFTINKCANYGAISSGDDCAGGIMASYLATRNKYDVATSMTELYNAGSVTVATENNFEAAIVGILRVPLLADDGACPIKIADCQNAAANVDSIIGNINHDTGNYHGTFTITRTYNATGVNILSYKAGAVNTTTDVTDGKYYISLLENCNKNSSADSLALLASSDKWVTDESGKPELEFIHEHDLGTTGTCSCGVTIFDEEIEFPEEIIFLMNNNTLNGTNLWAQDYKLVKNIDLTGYTQKPIGEEGNTFKGTFDGNGYTISGVNISTASKNTGFFGHVTGATIKNLTLKGTVVSTSGNNIAGFIGYAATPLTIQNCVNHIDVTGAGSWVGGFVGYVGLLANKALTIDNCINYGDITTGQYLGGIVGGNGGTSSGVTVNVTNCKNYGNVTATTGNCAGGIYGYNYFKGTEGTNTFTINRCANYGNVTSVNRFAGGIIGAYLPFAKASGYAINATFTELLNTGIVSTVNSDTNYLSVGGIAGFLGIHSADATITFQDCMHAGSTLMGGTVVDNGLIGRVGTSYNSLADSGLSAAVTFTYTNVYNAVGIEFIASAPTEYITEKQVCPANTTSVLSRLLEIAGKTNWVNEGTSTAPEPMLKAFHEHDFTSGTCNCGFSFDYKINTVEEMLIYMSNPTLWAHDCVLAADIDLTNVVGQSPIGTDATPFTGTFNGQNYTVTGLNIVTSDAGAGLFGVVKNATIKNVKLASPTVSGSEGVGALIGTAYAPLTVDACTVTNATVTSTGYRAAGIVGDILFSAASKAAKITNCTVTGGNITATGHVGGIVGRYRTSSERYASTAVASTTFEVSGCTSSATVYGDHYDQADVGGIVGRITVFSKSNTVTVKNNTNTGTVSGTTCVGGIIGRLNIDDNATAALTGNTVSITGNVNGNSSDATLGKITASCDFAGGIIGVIANNEATSLTVSGCYNRGAITAGAYAGGIVGSYYNRGTFTTTVKQSVTTCQNTGTVTTFAGEDYAGSQAGRNAGGIFGLVSTTSTPVTLSVLDNKGAVTAGYAYAGGIAGYIRSYGNGNASLTLEDARNSAKVTTDYSHAGGIVGYVSSAAPVTVQYTVSTGKVSGSTRCYALFGQINTNNDTITHNIHSNFYSDSSLTAGDRALYLNPATNTSTNISTAVEKMVAREAWVNGTGVTPWIEPYSSCGTGHAENEGDGWIWHYDSSAKQYYLTCKGCGVDYGHQDEAPTLYVGSNSLVGIDTNIGTTPETRLRTLEEAARRLVETGGTIRISGGIAMTENVVLPDWGDNTITFTADDTYHDTNGAVITGFLIKTMDVQLQLGGKAIFDDLLFKANDASNCRIIISANWHDIDMRYIRAQANARCYLLAGTYGERSTSENIDKTISTTINIDGPALADSQTIGYFYERIYLGSAPIDENLTIKNKTVTLNVQDGYRNTNATTRTLPALIYFLYAMSTADRIQTVFTDGCTSNIYLNDNSMVHAFSTGSRNVGEAGTATFDVVDADGNVTGTETVEFTDGNAYLDNLNVYFNDNSNIVDGLDKNGDGDFTDSGETQFAALGRFYIRNIKNTNIYISDEDGVDEYEGEGTRTEPLLHRMFFFRNGSFDSASVNAIVNAYYGRHGFLASFGDDVLREEGTSGNINAYNYTINEYVDPECDWDEGVVTNKPTPSATGTIKYTCIECGRTRTETLTHSHAYVVRANGTYYCYDFDENKVWTECSLTKPTTPVIIAATPKTASNNSVTVDVTITATTAIMGSKFSVDAPTGFVLKSATVKLPDTSTGTGLTAVTSGGTTMPYTVALVQNPAKDATVAKTVVVTLTFDVSAVDHTSNAHIVRVYDAASYNLAETSIETTAVSAEIIVDHEWSDWADVDGTNHSRTCSACGETESGEHGYNSDYAHQFITKSTWTEHDATQHCRTCTTCGYVNYSTHSYTKNYTVSEAVNPTPTTPGTTAVIMCDVCQHTEGGETIYYLIDDSVKFSARVTLLSEYILEYIIPKNDKVSECYMVFTYIENGTQTTAKVYPTNVNDLASPEDVKAASYDETKNYFEAPPIAAKEMADVIKGDYYYVLDGVLYKSNTRAINLISYYKAVKKFSPGITSEVNTALVNVLDAMFNYGAAAQEFFGYNTNNLATTKAGVTRADNSGIDEDLETLGTSNISGEAVSGQLYRLHGQSADLEQRIATVLYFKPENGVTIDTSNLVFKGGFMNVTGAWVAIEAATQKVNVSGTELVVVYVDRPAAKDLRVEFSGALYNGDTQVSPTITTSFELYAADIINTTDEGLVSGGLVNTTDKAAKLKEVCRSMLAYSDAAANYFNLYWNTVNPKTENN